MGLELTYIILLCIQLNKIKMNMWFLKVLHVTENKTKKEITFTLINRTTVFILQAWRQMHTLTYVLYTTY